MDRLNSRADLIALREECVKAFEAEKTKILVCGGTGCVAGGSLDIYARKKAAATASARWARWYALSRRAGFTQR